VIAEIVMSFLTAVSAVQLRESPIRVGAADCAPAERRTTVRHDNPLPRIGTVRQAFNIAFVIRIATITCTVPCVDQTAQLLRAALFSERAPILHARPRNQLRRIHVAREVIEWIVENTASREDQRQFSSSDR